MNDELKDFEQEIYKKIIAGCLYSLTISLFGEASI